MVWSDGIFSMEGSIAPLPDLANFQGLNFIVEHCGLPRLDQLIGRIQQKTGVARDAVEKFLGELTSHGGSAVAQAAQAVGDFAHTAGDRLRDSYGQVSDRVRDGYEKGEDIVRHNPTQSVAAAFGIGIVAGLIVGLALRSR